MNLDEFRRQMETYRQIVDEEARSRKDSYRALDQLHALYESFDGEERTMADQVLSEWVLSQDENLRFDALALVSDFDIVRAVPALRRLATLLASSSAPGAPYELEKVKRIIAGLR